MTNISPGYFSLKRRCIRPLAIAIEKIIVGKSNPDLLLDFYEKFGDFLR
jgi:hypothetical protein